MQTKLTLRLDKSLIERAKEYAREHDTSLSRIVSNHFRQIVGSEEPAAPEGEDWREELAPMTRSLLGVAKGSNLTEEDYWKHLEEKHR